MGFCKETMSSYLISEVGGRYVVVSQNDTK